MSEPPPRLAPLGDRAIAICLGTRIELALNRRIRRLADRIRAATLGGVSEVVAAYTTVTLYYDPLTVDYETLAQRLEPLLAMPAEAEPVPAGREFRFPVRYDGPDLEAVAQAAGLTVSEVIQRHSAPWYEVYVIGFVPGFAYLGDLDPHLVLPRRSEPRRRVPPGSVGIGGGQTGVYPLETPGGWHLLGHTDTVLFDLRRTPPGLLRVGDRVRFEPSGP